MTQISDQPEIQHADQAGSKDATEPEVLMDEAAAIQELSLLIEFHTWRAWRMANRQDKKCQARERIRQVRENGYRQGRGMYIFVISVPTMAKIVKHTKSLHTRSSREVCRIMIMMYKYGEDFAQTRPKVDRKTVNRYLLAAFRDLEISTGVRKEPSL